MPLPVLGVKTVISRTGHHRSNSASACYTIFWLAIITLILTNLYFVKVCFGAERVTVSHIVQQGESLADVGRIYADPSIADPRYLAEFTEGIREANPAIWYRDPRPGDRLLITIWAVVIVD